MKELTIEEKAERYDEAIKVAKGNYETIVQMDNDCTFAKEGIVNTFHHIFPELKESEDERIRKDIERAISVALDYSYFDKETANNCLAWLEKQGEQKPIIEMKSAEESLGIDSETYSKIVDECIYGEQKPADKIEPKFKKE